MFNYSTSSLTDYHCTLKSNYVFYKAHCRNSMHLRQYYFDLEFDVKVLHCGYKKHLVLKKNFKYVN